MHRRIPLTHGPASTRRLRRGGFTLIEVVVSIFIIGVVVVASAMLLQAAQANRVIRDQDLALKIANNKIGSLRAGGYAALPTDGPFTDPDLSSLASGAGWVGVSTYNTKTKQVDVSVSWTGGDQAAHRESLTTLITETGGL